MKYKFELFADYFQFYLQDEQSKGDLSSSWTEQAVSDMLAVAPGIIGVGTVTFRTVPVEVKVLKSPPTDNFERWSQVTEASLETPSGHIIIPGCTDYFPDAARIIVEPGIYRTRIYYGGLDSVDKSCLEGSDRYEVVLWLDTKVAEPKVLKKWKAA